MAYRFIVFMFAYVVIDLSAADITARKHAPCPLLKECDFRVETDSWFFGYYNNTSIKCKYNPKRPPRVDALASKPSVCGLITSSLTLDFGRCRILDSLLSSSYFRLLGFSSATGGAVYLKGIRRVNIESPLEIPNNWTSILKVFISDSSLRFVDQRGRVVESCDDFVHLKSSAAWSFFSVEVVAS